MTRSTLNSSRSLHAGLLPAVVGFVLAFHLHNTIPAAEPPAADSPASAWQRIAPFFSPPEQFADDPGDYRSPLRFADGRPVRSAAEWQTRRAELFKEWQELLGPWPPLITDPQVELLESTRRENFQQLRIRFKWTPREFTTGYLLIPDGDGPRPAVVTVYYEPETAIGLKAPQRDFAIQLARRGFVALSLGTTEATAARTYALYHPSIENAAVQPLSMLGCAAANAWYVLAQRPEVDSKRIGIVGHSFGGKWAMFASCLFDRFACAAWSDPGIVFDEARGSVNYWEPWYLGYHPRPWRKRGLITPDNPARGLYPKLTAAGKDLHELHALMAPRPFLVSGGSEDPPRRWRALNHTVAVNRLLGFTDRVGMTNRPDHSPNDESNAQIYAFFQHFLQARHEAESGRPGDGRGNEDAPRNDPPKSDASNNGNQEDAPSENAAAKAPEARRPVLQIINGSDQPIEVFWLKSPDERVSNGRVAPRKDTAITTTLGHTFVVVGQQDRTEMSVTSEVRVQAFRFDPPDTSGVPSFYTQKVSAGGFPIVASDKVSPYALREAKYLVDLMLAKRPDVRNAMILSGARLCVLAHNEYTTDHPEFARLAGERVGRFPGLSGKDFWDARARGMGGSERDPFCSCAEENLLGYAGDPYSTECILIHELAHNIHLRGMVNVDPTFDRRLKATYDAAMAAGLWKGKYASVNHHEYFAEGVQSWFDNNRENDHDHNHVNTRQELIDYDPRLAGHCRELFGETKLRYSKPATRLHGHLKGYDPAAAPTFEWPQRLDEARARIRRAAQERNKS